MQPTPTKLHERQIGFEPVSLRDILTIAFYYRGVAIIVGLVVWFGVLFFEAYRLDRRQGARDREAADRAAKARGELAADPWRAE